MRRLTPLTVLTAALAAMTTIACAREVRKVQITPGEQATIAELWQQPDGTRDLFLGPGGREWLPDARDFSFVAEDATGFSPGFDLKDEKGIEWSVKTGPEAQTEVVTSRVLWAVGFHQPPTYYVDKWDMKGAPAGPREPGRFRPDVPGREVVGEWKWHENPFVGTSEYGGLIVANLLLTSWDWKTSNNKIYEFEKPVDGVTRHFVVRDVGASLGKFTYPTVLKWFRLRGFGQGTRNDLPGFEEQGFIEKVDGDKVHFAYRGIYRDVIGTVTPTHVRWACERLDKITEEQWRDAFRAGGYTPEQTSRYVAKIKAKIAQGLALTEP